MSVGSSARPCCHVTLINGSACTRGKRYRWKVALKLRKHAVRREHSATASSSGLLHLSIFFPTSCFFSLFLSSAPLGGFIFHRYGARTVSPGDTRYTDAELNGGRIEAPGGPDSKETRAGCNSEPSRGYSVSHTKFRFFFSINSY